VSDVRTNAIPGVRCGKCLGRIDQAAIDMGQRIHAKLARAGAAPPPRLCTECLFTAMLMLCTDDDDEGTST